MYIEQRRVGEVVVPSAIGDIAMNAAGATLMADGVRRALQEGHARLVLDLRHVRYVDSVGLGELVQAFSAVRNRGGVLNLLNVTRRLNDLHVVSKLLTVFDCFDRESDALASVESQPVSQS
jgi:anti-sigma B factor antagonist